MRYLFALTLLYLAFGIPATAVATAGPRTPPPPPTPTIRGCPPGWVCFYKDKNWHGRMVKARQQGKDLRLSSWHFADMTSSWVDNEPTSCSVEVDGNTQQNILWFEGTYQADRYVGPSLNDKANWFYISPCK